MLEAEKEEFCAFTNTIVKNITGTECLHEILRVFLFLLFSSSHAFIKKGLHSDKMSC